MRIRVSVNLVGDEQAEHDKRCWIGPEFVSEQPNDEERLNYPVAKEIEGIEVLGAHAEIVGQAGQMRADKIVRIFDQLVLGECVNPTDDCARAYDGQYQAPYTLDQRVSSLQQDADFKYPMDTAFVHSAPEWSD